MKIGAIRADLEQGSGVRRRIYNGKSNALAVGGEDRIVCPTLDCGQAARLAAICRAIHRSDPFANTRSRPSADQFPPKGESVVRLPNLRGEPAGSGTVQRDDSAPAISRDATSS